MDLVVAAGRGLSLTDFEHQQLAQSQPERVNDSNFNRCQTTTLISVKSSQPIRISGLPY